MPKRPDIFAVLPQDVRMRLMRRTVMKMMGPKMGDQIWKQMEPAMVDMSRQPGDAPRPEDNYWKGLWRIHEAE